VNIVFHQPLLELVNELRAVTPPALDGFFFSNSGAEAVEGAVKLARHATGRATGSPTKPRPRPLCKPALRRS
jgi:4-aminobutyrate aminotransferase